jgi:hypothetical protein
VLEIDSADPGLHGALLVGALGRLALVVKRAARQALQQVCQLVVMPQRGNQTRFVGAADLFDRIKACSSFLRYATSAQSLVLLLLGFFRIGGDHVRRRRIASFLFHLGTLLSRSGEPAGVLDRDCGARQRPLNLYGRRPAASANTRSA